MRKTRLHEEAALIKSLYENRDACLTEIQKLRTENAKLREALRYLSIQVLPEEYEEECGLEMDESNALEAYEHMVLKAREALKCST